MIASGPNKDRIRKLVEALRSGEYTQGIGQLTFIDKDGNEKDCCLGVACKVAIKDGLELSVVRVGDGLAYGTERETGILPSSVREYYGFSARNPALNVLRVMYTASSLNDSVHYSLGEIADAFERTYLSDNDK